MKKVKHTDMVSSRQRSSLSTTSESTSSPAIKPTKALTKPPLEEWTTKEKLCLASLAIKHGNAWNSVARNMQSFVEKDRPDGWSNQKTCAAQFDKLMNELGVDKRPKRNEPSDGNSSSVIYKKMAEKRIKELEESIVEVRKMWLSVKNDLDALENGTLSTERTNQLKQKLKTATTKTTPTTTPAASTPTTTNTTTSTKNPSKATTQTSEVSEKPPTRALTRRESSRQNLEKTLAMLCREASELESINLICKPSQENERELYDKVIFKHMDISIIKKRLGGEVEDPYAVMNDLLLMFQNATMFYPVDHPIHKTALELGEKLVPQWEKALLERFKSKH